MVSSPALQGSSLGSHSLEGQQVRYTQAARRSVLRPRKLHQVVARKSADKSVATRSQGTDSTADPVSSTAFLVALASLNTAAAGAALAAGTATPTAVQGPQAVTAITAAGSGAVDKAVSTAVDAVKATGGLLKSGLGAANNGLSVAKQTYTQVAPVVEDAVKQATPYVKTAASTAGKVAGPVVKAVTPVVQSGIDEASRFLNRSGVQPEVIVRKGELAAEQAGDIINRNAPQVSQQLGKLTSSVNTSDPNTLGKYALGLAALYFLGPTVLRVLFGSFRGYRGDITPAAALDALANDGNTVLVDIRTSREKESSGIPDLPNSGKLIELEFATVDNRSTRGQIRDVNAVERTMTVLQIAALKKVRKGSTVLLMDKNGGGAKAVARELSGRGFRKVFVISGGFQGWTGSKLQTRLSNSVSAVEVLSPGNIFGTQRMRGSTPASRRALPSGR